MRALRFLLLAVASVLLCIPNSWGQSPSAAAPRIKAQIDENQRVTLSGNTHPYARA